MPLSGRSNSEGGFEGPGHGLDQLLHDVSTKGQSGPVSEHVLMAGPSIEIRAGRRTVRISSADKLLFPADGITKADLARYYAGVAPVMAPHVKDRPLNLWRWNAGIEKPVVIQQAIPKGAPDWVRTVTVERRKGGEVTHAVGGEAATLRLARAINCITPHAWPSRADRPGFPDRIVFDLDPPDEDAAAHFPAIRAGALLLGERLRGLGPRPPTR